MNSIQPVFVAMVDAASLVNFADMMGIRDLQAVRSRLCQLRQTDQTSQNSPDNVLASVGENTPQNASDFQLALDFVAEKEDVDESIKALLYDDEMDEMSRICIADGEWEPMSGEEELDQIPDIAEEQRMQAVQVGNGDEPRPGPSNRPDTPPQGLSYNIREKSKRTYAKNSAIDTCYEVKVDDQHHGQQLRDVRQGLHDMFDNVLAQARGDLAGNDLGRVVIQHNDLHDPIVVPLQRWDQIDANTVMETIEKVLNSHQNLSIDESFDVSVGTIDMPKGGARRRITKLDGSGNSAGLKKCIVTIENDDQLCMARAISVSWAKLNSCSVAEWKIITESRGTKSNLELILQHRKVPESHFKNLTSKQGRGEQKDLAEAISRFSGVPTDRPASLSDIPAFETVLGVRVMVISARLGNKFITTASTDERPCIYIYLVDDTHFHSVTRITAFFQFPLFLP